MMKTWVKLLILVLLISAAIAAYAISTIKSVAMAYLYGYPLVVMDQSRLVSSKFDEIENVSSANRFKHLQTLPDHRFRNVVRPNNDTVYSSAWIDLTHEPVILSIPDTNGRYYVMPFMDAWTNVFAMIGERANGNSKGVYGVVGPQWSGVLPDGITMIESPTNMVWLVGRIKINGDHDIANVRQLQKQFVLRPLSQWVNGSGLNDSFAWDDRPTESPMETVENFTADEYFSALASLLSSQPSPLRDRDALINLANLGVVPGQNFDSLGPIDSFLYNSAIAITRVRLDEEISSRANLENGWSVHRSIIGNYSTNYAIRAAVAKVGLGALPPKEAVYPNTNVSSDGRTLSGDQKYKIHFASQETPPVDAFWSLSMYDEDGYFIENKLNRYSIGDRNALKFNPDGSLDIWIQADEPETGTNNWLPAPPGRFALTMRLYRPKERFLNGDWQLPEVQKVSP